MMSSFIPSTIQDTINSLITQITNVYKAFIQHTKTFFVDSNNNANINSNSDINLTSLSGDINLISPQPANIINLNSLNAINLTTNSNLSIGTTNSTSNNDLSIFSTGQLYLGSNDNAINLYNPNENSTENKLAILWGQTPPSTNTYSVGSLFISTSGNLYIYTNSGWNPVMIQN